MQHKHNIHDSGNQLTTIIIDNDDNCAATTVDDGNGFLISRLLVYLVYLMQLCLSYLTL